MSSEITISDTRIASLNKRLKKADDNTYKLGLEWYGIGRELHAMKKEAGHGNWEQFVADNLAVGARQCSRYLSVFAKGLPKSDSESVLSFPKTVEEAAGGKPKQRAKPAQKTAVEFSDLPDEPGVDPVAEALEEDGPPQLGEQKSKLPTLDQMQVVQLDKKLTGFNPAQKRATRKFIKDEVSRQVASAVTAEQSELNIMIIEYASLLKRGPKDIKLVLASLHPDRPDRTKLQLTKSFQAFQRLAGES